jgi:hypothetical protein
MILSDADPLAFTFPTLFTFAPPATATCTPCRSFAAWHLGGSDSDTLCNTPWFDSKKLTAVALEADCENCRSHPSVMVGPVAQRGCERREARGWMTEPMADADEVIEAAKKVRDGR